LPNHQHHEWKDSFNNPRSTNFKGTAKTPKDSTMTDPRGENEGKKGKYLKEIPNISNEATFIVNLPC